MVPFSKLEKEKKQNALSSTVGHRTKTLKTGQKGSFRLEEGTQALVI